MDRWLFVQYAILSCVVLFNSSVLGKSKVKSVTTLLDAKWKTTPLVLEISEFLAEERNEHFWKYVDKLCDIDPDFLKDRTDKELYDIAIREAESLLSPSAVNLLKFSLSTRVYSPTVEMFHQIAVSQNMPEGCHTVIEVNSKFTCDLMDLNRLVDSAVNRNKSQTYKTDHRYQGSDSHDIIAVLYGELATNSFREFHFILQNYAKQGRFDYIIRHFIPDRPDKKARLSGYGVELSIKSTEYKAQDDAKIKSEGTPDDVDTEEKQDEVEGFVFSKLKLIFPDRVAKLDTFRDHLLQSTNDMVPLKVWQLQDLGLQAAERIVTSPVEEALRVMRDISQNFPLQARSLLKHAVRDELKKEMAKNQNIFAQNHNLATTDTSLFINGVYFNFDSIDIFTIINVLRQELRIMEELHRLGVEEEQMDKILQLDLGALKQEYAIDIRDSAIQYVNDIETDKKYSTWPSSISELLRPTYPGMLRSIRKNIFHLVFVVDPCHDSAKDLLKLAESFYVHRAPIRIGLLLAVGTDSSRNGFQDCGVAMLNAFNFISQDKGQIYDGLAFITDVYATVLDKQVTVDNVVKFFRTKYPDEDVEMIFGDDSDYDTGRKLTNEFLEKTGLDSIPEVLLNGVGLDRKYLTGDMFEEAVLSEIIKQTHTLQKAVYKGLLTDSQTVLDYLMEMPNVMPRINGRVLNETWKLVDLTGTPLVDLSPSKFAELSTTDMAATVLSHMKYLTARDDNNFRPITNWIITDLEAEDGRQLFLAALEQMKSSDVRVGLVFNPSTTPSETSHQLSKNVYAALQLLTKKPAIAVITKMLNPNTVDFINKGEKSLRDCTDVEESAYGEAVNLAREMLKIHQRFCKKVLSFQPGDMGIVSNGRILGPFNEGESFTLEDFSLLDKHSTSIYGEKMRDVFQGINSAGELDSISDLSMRVSSLILGTQSSARVDLKYQSTDYSVVKIPPKTQRQPVLDIKVIVNPLSKGAQKASAILAVLHEVVNAKITVFLNSEEKLSDMPLKTFYRFVLEPEVQFSSDDSYGPGPIARFANMPTSPLLTLQMNTPENWLVEVMRTPFDLDNIRLEDVDSAVWSEFELEHLLIEGHCFDLVTGNPPRGLQFTLGRNDNLQMVDTIVMANLGYFQLKANPGAWQLRLRNGRSAEIYDIVSHDGTDSPPNATSVPAVINDFRSNIVKIQVSKKPGKQHVDLLADEVEEKHGLWDSITKEPLKYISESAKQVLESIWSTFIGSDTKNKDEDDDGTDDKINIFSLASGHLYERLLRIMMLSVVKHAKTPVKFWFLKNYLSPTFKDILPHMAKEYKFEYELVQYKWPRWLHQQTEKQRIIWGYKILFLDVLFPLSVKKIIFVDADQVVRADMTELRDLDLGGAPYGYTPFCESRKEMDGYRFWKSGYWSSHLQGRKYHISALYVVDLKKFRRIAAGDRLRGQYQGLSQDPNSLSNLDQDLPNNMIHQVYIKSLPQEWLWCETWCDDASKAKAKTIDVCNNPQTKESKLSSAMRIIPEWKDYDEEIRKLLDKIKLEKAKTSTAPTTTKDQKHGRKGISGTGHEEL